MTAFSLYYESTVFDPIELPRLRVVSIGASSPALGLRCEPNQS